MKKEEAITILITGAGAPGIKGTLYALHNNEDKIQIKSIGVDTNQDAVGSYLVDSFYQVPAPEEVNYIDKMLEICCDEKVQLIIPQTTKEISILSLHKQKFSDNGIQVMVSDTSAIQKANNKWSILESFRQLKLPIPDYRLSRTKEEFIQYVKDLGYPTRPVVVKLPVSNGMRGLRILRENAWDLQRFITEKPNGVEICLDQMIEILESGERWPELLVTEYLPGEEYSVDAFVGDYIQVAVPRLRKSIRSGISFENKIEYREDLSSYTLQAAKHLGLSYAFGFQFKLDIEGVPKVLECNPRVQGTMVASIFSGVNIIWMSVKEALGMPPKKIPTHIDCATFSRYWGGIGIVDGKIEII